MTSAARHPALRPLAGLMMMAALLMQLLAAPMAAGMMAQMAGATAFKICSTHETKTVLLDRDGNEIAPPANLCAKCPMCFVSAAGALPGLVLISFFSLPAAEHPLPGFGLGGLFGSPHPPSQAPPSI